MDNLIGIIGGSGLYSLFEDQLESKEIFTPFGAPSGKFTIGHICGKKVVFLPRHGKDHQFLPHEVNYPANIYGMKELGVNQIISVSAVGSLKEEMAPRDAVIVDQFFDRTSKRPQSFFGNGLVAHVSFGDPVCPSLRKTIINTLKNSNVKFHPKGTYVNMEGPQFSTRAESNFYRQLGFDVIGMTNMSEARLAREAEICYSSIAFVTDYDCWREEDSSVTTDVILQVLKDNAANAKQIISNVFKNLDTLKQTDCNCQSSLQSAMVTPIDKIPENTKKTLYPILKKYL